MKRMQLCFLLIGTIATTALNSCSSDDDAMSPEGELVGNWEATSYVVAYYRNGEEYMEPDTLLVEEEEYVEFRFHNNGNFSGVGRVDGEEESIAGAYTVEENNITLTIDGEHWLGTYELAGDNLSMILEFEETRQGDTYLDVQHIELSRK